MTTQIWHGYGRTVVTASSDRTARLWSYAALDAATSTICNAVSRDVTPAEKAVYLPERSTNPLCPA
ncbi:hypothetical protein [Kitasatospora sp. NPDC054795]